MCTSSLFMIFVSICAGLGLMYFVHTLMYFVLLKAYIWVIFHHKDSYMGENLHDYSRLSEFSDPGKPYFSI